MVESVIGSMASSVDLAKSMLEEVDDETDAATSADLANSGTRLILIIIKYLLSLIKLIITKYLFLFNAGVNDIAHIIDAVLSRMTVTFTDTVVRLEANAIGQPTLAHAIELTIDK